MSYETFLVPIVLYGSECWCLRKETNKEILVAEMTWLRRRLLRVTIYDLTKRWDSARQSQMETFNSSLIIILIEEKKEEEED